MAAFAAGIKAAVGGATHAVHHAVAPMVAAPPPPPPDWQSRLGQHSEPVEGGEWLFACCCPMCAAAAAKSKVDNSPACYNFFCWNPVAARSWIRMSYHITGVCGDDICYGTFCMPCVIRQLLTESRLRGPAVHPPYGPPMQGANQGKWTHSLFDCSPPELCYAMVCPCCLAHEVRTGMQPEASQSCCFDAMFLLPTAMYGQVRNHYGILSDFPGIEDVTLPLVCAPCALIRASHQVEHVKRHGIPMLSAPLVPR